MSQSNNESEKICKIISNMISPYRYTYSNYKRTIKKDDDNTQNDRTPFHKDYDRIIFSNSFRRLSKKTQVHPLSKNDHVHNRMTHSLETASVGRSLGIHAGKFLLEKCQKNNEKIPYTPYDIATIVQTACLAHDIGNPPFGHAGEEVIRDWFKNCDNKNDNKKYLESLKEEEKKDFLSFDGNAQSIRIVCSIEHNEFVGMRLTFPTIASMIKYPWNSSSSLNTNNKFSFFKSESKLIHEIFEKLGLVKEDDRLVRHPFSYLTEMADDICYGLLDLQDAVELEILTIDELKNIFKNLCGQEDYTRILNDSNLNILQKISKMVAYSINNLVQHVSFIFEENFLRIAEEEIKDLFSIFKDGALIDGLKEAKSIAKSKIFNERRKIQLEIGAYNVIDKMLDNFIPMAYEFHEKGNLDKLSFKNKRLMSLMGIDSPKENDSLYTKYQKVLDYIVGMTDNYATFIAHQMIGMGY